MSDREDKEEGERGRGGELDVHLSFSLLHKRRTRVSIYAKGWEERSRNRRHWSSDELKSHV